MGEDFTPVAVSRRIAGGLAGSPRRDAGTQAKAGVAGAIGGAIS
jgi:hypothetical protein